MVGTVAIAALIYLLASYVGIEPRGFTTELSFPIAVVIYALIPAIAEEGIFRYMLPRIFETFGKRATVALTALLFSVSHFHLLSLPYTLFAGVMFGIAAAVTGAPYLSLAVHFINNLAGVAAYFILRDQSVKLEIVPTTALLALVTATLGLILLFVIFRASKKALVKASPKIEAHPPKASEIIASPVALFALICILMGVLALI